ncbi:NrfD/PsrC family molybdoenzyme membrane anchor subunit [Nonomuraea jiangxiensis]|uniref:Formate-dependent nitrite reductase, membrane component NrfD n=1 Tax=Nonomuraea jiangxiensis TaxID=633440 RepID=A0A1G8SAW0_9ACTN|nr:NrfD/PsrC family molybdoenzyme membrane anchor subunit [Nonomuraea jiangxiensis]SDJ25790.1 Formate-dependent nitrite reductase, membrane component NrfD [Nonomuraea jiangxiensis]
MNAHDSSQTDVRLDDSPELRPEREATVGSAGRRRRPQRGERLMVPDAEFRSYYGRPVLQETPWQAPDIAGYLFLGGLAGASSVLAATAELSGRPRLARACKTGALCALGGSLYALIHDLGRPQRFLYMLRTFKVTSPMSVGTWILTAYGPQAGLAAATAVTGLFPRLGRAATMGAGLTGGAVATYTAALVANTAVPAWHDGHRELPYLFAGSAAASAGGLGMLAAPLAEAGPARRLALAGAVAEYAAAKRMERRMGPVAEPLKRGPGGLLLRLGTGLSLSGAAAGILLGRRDRRAAVAAGAALLAGAICTRFGIFHAGLDSSRDPAYTVEPQRARLSHPSQAPS